MKNLLHALLIMLIVLTLGSTQSFAQTFNPALVVAPPIICPGDDVVFVDSNYTPSSGIIYDIVFGDGQQSLNITQSVETILPALAVHNYTTGSFNYTFTARDAFGHTKTITGSIMASPFMPSSFDVFIAGNSTQNLDACPNENIVFYVLGGKSYVWHFGDGTTSTTKKSYHSYSTVGTYASYVVATNGCNRSQTIQNPAIVSANNPPFTDFLITPNSSPTCKNTQFLLTPINTDTIQLNTYKWYFDGIAGETTRIVNHVFSTAGNHSIKLVMSNNCGTDSATRSVFINEPTTNLFINNSDVTPNDATPYTICPNSNLSFETSISNKDQNIYVKYYFGDGTTSLSHTPSHTYTSIGTYPFKAVFYNVPCDDSVIITKTIKVDTTLIPVFNMWATNWNACPNEPVFFNTDMQDAEATYLWTFGDGYTSTQKNPIHTFSYPNDFNVTLQVINGCGKKSTKNTTISISNTNPANAGINYSPQDACPGQNINFFGNGGVTYIWNMGDNTTKTSTNVLYNYADTGTYIVSLIATNECGISDTTTTSIVIQKTPDNVKADLYFENYDEMNQPDTLTICPGESVSFKGKTQMEKETLLDFGDGNSTTQTNNSVSHTFTNAGFRIVKFIAFSNCWSDTSIKYVNVNSGTMPSPTLVIIPSIASSGSDTICPGESAYFFDNENHKYDGSLKYSIWFGDDDSLVNIIAPTDTIIGVLAAHKYTSENVYIVKFTSTNLCGNTYELTDQIVVSTQKAIDTTFYHIENSTKQGGSNAVCPGEQVDFIIAGGISYKWNFADGSPVDTNQNPKHAYATTNNYYAFCIATNGCGKVDTLYTLVTISGTNKPSSNVDVQGAWGSCIGDTIRVAYWNDNNNSYTYLWNFNDGTTSTERNPNHVYQTAGNFTLIGQITNGCGTTTTSNNIIINNTVVNLGTDYTICQGESSYIGVDAMQYQSYSWSTGSQSNGINVSQAGTYSISVTDNQGCSASDAIVITTNPAPTATVSADVNICPNIQTTLTASGGTNFIWSTNETTSSIDVNPLQTTTYYVNVGANNCFDNAQVVVTVETCTGIAKSENTNYSINIYPNPSEGLFNLAIKGMESSATISIYTLDGQLIFNENINNIPANGFVKEMNVSNYSQGLYFIKIVDSKNILTDKLMIH